MKLRSVFVMVMAALLSLVVPTDRLLSPNCPSIGTNCASLLNATRLKTLTLQGQTVLCQNDVILRHRLLLTKDSKLPQPGNEQG
jgi:hypothetical protein